jgi:hypothetical protein
LCRKELAMCGASPRAYRLKLDQAINGNITVVVRNA